MASTEPEDNHLLAALPDEVMARWKLHLGLVTFTLGQMLYESGDMLDSVFFPNTTIVSLR